MVNFKAFVLFVTILTSLRYVFSWRSAVKYLSKFGVRTSYIFIRLIIPVFIFQAVPYTKNV